MKSFVTSYSRLFDRPLDDGQVIEQIEIPLIQRDYAQGRQSAEVARIRSRFLGALHEALTSDADLHLDFVYGDVRNGYLCPLDGQQRLTTLFLLHWYLAYRADRLDAEPQAWKRFGYAVRPSARLFCERLGGAHPQGEFDSLATWIEDQPWYLPTWRHDPTIASMLVMLDAIHERFASTDWERAWERLVEEEQPAITFHLLPMREPRSGEDLYIKMNSRGKPLTPFENFKARLEKLVTAEWPERARKLAARIDGPWADLFWPYRGADQLIDDELMRFFHFIFEVCEWRAGRTPQGDVESLAEALFDRSRGDAGEHLDFLTQAFDCWAKQDVRGVFEEFFAQERDGERVVLFNLKGEGVDLFERCCQQYGSTQGRNRSFSLQLTLLLYAVLLHRMRDTTDFATRVRMVRNLIEASDNEIRFERMPELMVDVERIVVEGSLEAVGGLNQAHTKDEQDKSELVARVPEIRSAVEQLEDHPLLRGSLASFDLDPKKLPDHARNFDRVFQKANYPALTGALLAQGAYARKLANQTYRFGSPSLEQPWRDALAGADRSRHEPSRRALTHLLDRLRHVEDIGSGLAQLSAEYLRGAEAEARFDWRYYLVKYPAMRKGDSGIYVSEEDALGYRLCMLRRRYLNSNYRDAFLYAVYEGCGLRDRIEDPWFSGYTDKPRWMRLTRSGLGLRCVDEGYALQCPNEDHRATFEATCATEGVAEHHVLRMPQATHDGRTLDMEDRVERGIALVRALVGAGL